MISRFFKLNSLQIKARGSQLRGEAKTKTASLVEALYGFDSGRSKRAIAENRRIAEELKDNKGFVFEVSFRVLIFGEIIIIIWFSGTFRWRGKAQGDI